MELLSPARLLVHKISGAKQMICEGEELDPYNRALEIYRGRRSRGSSSSPRPSLKGFRRGYDQVLGQFPPAEDTVVSEMVFDGIRALRVSVESIVPERTVLYLHGGGYICGNPEGVRDLCSRLSRAAQAEVVVPAYRLAPEHRFPAAIEDSVSVFRALLACGNSPSSIAIAGDSAGGGLALATTLFLRDSGSMLPAAVVCYSPLGDLEATGRTMFTKSEFDPFGGRDAVLLSAENYLGGQSPSNPLASPVQGEFSNMPPILLQVGTEEILLSDAVRIAEAAGEAGVQVRLEIEPRMPHVFQYFASFLPGAQAAIERSAAFIMERTSQ